MSFLTAVVTVRRRMAKKYRKHNEIVDTIWCDVIYDRFHRTYECSSWTSHNCEKSNIFYFIFKNVVGKIFIYFLFGPKIVLEPLNDYWLFNANKTRKCTIKSIQIQSENFKTLTIVVGEGRGGVEKDFSRGRCKRRAMERRVWNFKIFAHRKTHEPKHELRCPIRVCK